MSHLTRRCVWLILILPLLWVTCLNGRSNNHASVFAAAASTTNVGSAVTKGVTDDCRFGPFHPNAVREFIMTRCNCSPDGGGGGGGILLDTEKRTNGGKRRRKQGKVVGGNGGKGGGGGGGGGAAVWVYEGSLYDPFNGKKIADVEGLELVRHLTECIPPPRTTPSSDEEPTGGGATRTGIGKKRRVGEAAAAAAAQRIPRSVRRLGDLSVRQMLFPTMSRQEPPVVESTKEMAAVAVDVSKQQKPTPPSPPSWDYSTTILSRKLFCYRHPTNRHSVLRNIRLHPKSPQRKVALHEAVALYDTATTYISRDNGRELVVQTEWPDGRWIMGTADVNYDEDDGGDVDNEENTRLQQDNNSPSVSSSSPGTFDFTVYARRSSNDDLPTLQPTRRKKSSSNDIVVSPPRAKFIQFGPDRGTTEKHRYGARETYSYTLPNDDTTIKNSQNTNPFLRLANRITNPRAAAPTTATNPSSSSVSSPTVRYTRYGECPPWYGIGKMATLELRGRRIDDVSDAPPLAASLAGEKVPGFLSVHTPIPTMGSNSNDALNSDKGRRQRQRRRGGDEGGTADEAEAADDCAVRAVRCFRGYDGTLPLKLLEGDEEHRPNGQQKFREKIVERSVTLAKRVWDATTTSNGEVPKR